MLGPAGDGKVAAGNDELPEPPEGRVAPDAKAVFESNFTIVRRDHGEPFPSGPRLAEAGSRGKPAQKSCRSFPDAKRRENLAQQLFRIEPPGDAAYGIHGGTKLDGDELG